MAGNNKKTKDENMEKALCQRTVRKEELSRQSGFASRAIGHFLDGAASCIKCGKPANRMVYHIADDTPLVTLRTR